MHLTHAHTLHFLCIRPWLLVILCLLTGAGKAHAQQARTAQTWFVAPQVGVASYVGDREKALFSFDSGLPYTAGLELGYQFSPVFSLSGGYLLGSYPGVNAADENDLRHTARLFLRYGFRRAGVTPYVQAGAHATFGSVTPAGGAEETKTAFGPLLGLGLDVPVSGRMSLFIGATSHLAFPDDAVDGRDDGGSGSFDLLSSFGAGFKFNFKSGVVKPEVLALEGPGELRAGQAGRFIATVNEKATRPVEYQWEWGDGTTSHGLTVQHTYGSPGTYTVRFTATNRGGTDTETLTVRVIEAVAANIVTMSADPMTPDTRTPVRFSANVRGTAPLSYRWDFGDGTTSAEAEPTHTFGEAGTYVVELAVENAFGRDRRTLSISVQSYLAELCLEVAVMNAAFFDRNASVLTDAARRSLDENVEILLECPNLNVRLEGFAAPGERQPQQLSRDRASAVAAYYREQGVAGSRIDAVGMGQASGMTSKKEGAGQFRRVDSIPLR